MALVLAQPHWKTFLDSMKILSRGSSKSFVPAIWILFLTISRDHIPIDMWLLWIADLNWYRYDSKFSRLNVYLEPQLLGRYQTLNYQWDLYKFDTVWFDLEYKALTGSNMGSISSLIPVHHHHYPNETWLLWKIELLWFYTFASKY